MIASHRKATLLAVVTTIALALAYISVAEVRDEARSAGPLAPHEALSSFRLKPGFHIELVACEPAIMDPVAMASWRVIPAVGCPGRNSPARIT